MTIKRWKLAGAAAAVVVVAGVTVALAAPRGFKGLEEIGQRAYWSLLSEGQRQQAKVIAADYMAATAPDRLAVASRVLRFQSDVVAVLTIEQRKETGTLRFISKNLPDEKRRENLERLLAGMDREAVATRVAQLEAAAPEERVHLAVQIFDRFYDAVEPKVATQLKLTDDQRARIRALAAEAKSDVRPVAVRIAQAKAGAVDKGLALLDAEQRQKLDQVRVTIRSRVLEFIRGT